jgi:hypothetical protein
MIVEALVELEELGNVDEGLFFLTINDIFGVLIVRVPAR